MSFHTVRQVAKSRKAKFCYWCAERINIGEPKIYVAGMWEGDFFDDSLHPECYAALERYLPRGGEWPEEGSFKRGTTDER